MRWAISLSGLLFLLKGAIALISSSQALLASALDSLMDVGISSINWVSVKKASNPPDKDHAYGHGKIESLASYSQGIIILIFAFLLFGEGVRRTISGNFVSHSELALAAVGLAVSVNLVLITLLQKAEQHTKSLILKAEKTHYLMDLLSYLVVFLALALVRLTGWPAWDGVGGIFVAGYVAWLASQILFQAANELVDRSLPKGTLEELDALIKGHDPRVLSYHKLRTRKVGEKTFMDFHLVMRPKQSFQQAHEIAESLIHRIRMRFPNADVTVHEDPKGGI